MTNPIAFAASIVINVALFAALHWSVLAAQAPPVGEVAVTQLPSSFSPDELDALAHAGEVAPLSSLL